MQQQKNMISTVTLPFYQNGAHAGNVYYHVDVWGMNSPKIEAEIERRLKDVILQIQSDWKAS